MKNSILAIAALSYTAVSVSCSCASTPQPQSNTGPTRTGGAGGSAPTSQAGGSAGGFGGTSIAATGGSPSATGGTTLGPPGTGGAGAGGTTPTGGTASAAGGTTASTKPTGSGGTTGGASSNNTGGGSQTGGTPATGGTSSGGAGAGGSGAATGGAATGGTGAGGIATGGVAIGGTGGATSSGGTTSSKLKPRLVVLTDIAPDSVEPDDAESMIRLLAHADLFEIEGLVAGEGYNTDNYPASWADRIGTSIDAYEKDAPNLRKRSNQSGYLTDENQQAIGYWPSPAYLRSRKMLGSARMGVSVLGASNDSDGSKLIIKLADEDDNRPIWVSVWGGANTLAQAIWRVKNDRTADQLKAFLHKVRIYTITDQDKPNGSTDYPSSSHQWMRKQVGTDLLFIWDECAWLSQNSTGVNHWSEYATNIQNHGNLGAIYPKYRWGVEGDTPSYLHLMPTGLNDPDVPGQGSWGGFFAYGPSADGQTSAWVNQQGSANTTCNKYEASFYPATFNNFAARMDWAKDGAGNRNPVVVVNDNEGMGVITMKPASGAQVTLDASKTSDPDGDKLTFKWWVYSEAGTYTQSISIANSSSNKATIAVPADSAGKNFHVICEVTDGGTPNLTSYRRIVFEPTN